MGNEQSTQQSARDAGDIIGAIGEIVERVGTAANVASPHHQNNDIARILGTIGSSVGVLGTLINEPAQHERLLELALKHDLAGLIKALASPAGVHFDPDFFPKWMREVGGYFPKFAQVLSVRADLIRNPEVLAGFSRCLEDMPVRDVQTVREHLLQEEWPHSRIHGTGVALAAGTVAQVNQLTLPDGTPAVVKVAWKDTREKMITDFRLFAHSRQILGKLDLVDNRTAQMVASMFDAVAKNEAAVLAEFDLLREASALRTAGTLCADEWRGAHRSWVQAIQQAAMQPEAMHSGRSVRRRVEASSDAASRDAAMQPGDIQQGGLTGIPPHLVPLALAAMQQSLNWRTQVPVPLPGYCSARAMGMSHAGGESIHKLLEGFAGQAGQQEAASVLLAHVVPFIGWLLLCKSTTHLAHVDPHPGNFRWDADAQVLWVLDWGSHITLTNERRRTLCLLLTLIANNAEDTIVAETAASFGCTSDDDHRLAEAVRGMVNASLHQDAQDTLNHAAPDNVFKDISQDIVPVVRCLAILGGMLKKMQQRLHDQTREDIPLSLATLWAPFAQMGLS